MSDAPDAPPTPPADPPPAPPADPPAPEPPADPPPAPSDSGDRLSRVESIIEGLTNTVATLVDTVARQATPDENPAKVPWTHRGGRKP